MRRLASVVLGVAALAVALVSCGDDPTELEGLGRLQIADRDGTLVMEAARDGSWRVRAGATGF